MSKPSGSRWARQAPPTAPIDLAFLAGTSRAAAAVLDRAAAGGRVTGTLGRRVAVMALHHAEHAETLGEIAGGHPAANPSVVEAFGGRLGATAEEPDAAAVLLDLVNAVTATQLAALATLTDEVAYTSLASIVSVVSRHGAVLAHAAGRSPVSDMVLPVTEPVAEPLDPAAFPPGP